MRRLLVAHDFSPGSERALLRALRLATRHRASIQILHCIDGSDDAGTLSARRRLVEEAQIMADEVGSPELEIAVQVRTGNAADAILAGAEALDADLIVMGGHGAPRLRDALFGTTATHVVRHSDRPVLVVQDGGPAAYPEVMIAVDDPVAVQPLLTTALAVAPTARIVAVHAFHPSLGQTLSGDAELERQKARIEEEIRSAVAAAVNRTGQPPSVDLQAVIETGEVMAVLMKSYEALQPALLALGTRERSTYLGSHAVDTLFWCPHDLLVVPDRARVMAMVEPRAAVAAGEA